ncbi:MAG: hypothetical protein IH943_11330 [Acidobacteria bacterium]|nr:hypothetical protein [Acidobacteriota bacterium]
MIEFPFHIFKFGEKFAHLLVKLDDFLRGSAASTSRAVAALQTLISGG